MSVQSGVTTSSPVSRLAYSYREKEQKHNNSNSRYAELSGASSPFLSTSHLLQNSQPYNEYQQSRHPSSPPQPPQTPQEIRIKYRKFPGKTSNYSTPSSRKPNVRYESTNLSTTEYDICCRALTYCTLLILSGTFMVLSRKFQNQSLTEYKGKNMQFRHQWIQTWFFFVAKSFLIILTCFPSYDKASGISSTYHSRIMSNISIAPQNGLTAQQLPAGYSSDATSSTISRNLKRSRQKRFKSFCMQHVIYFAMALLMVLSQFLMNIALFYMSGSIWIISTSIIILYVSGFKFFLIKPSILVFIGVFCIITGNIMMISTEIHQLSIIGDYDKTTIFFSFASFGVGLLFLTFYYMIYEYYYDEYREYINLLIKLKTLRASKKEKFEKDEYVQLQDIERNMIFYNWNHIKFIYMEGIYGLIITSIIISILVGFNIDDIIEDRWIYYWFYENIANFIHILSNSPLNICMTILFVISIMINTIIKELSKSYLTSYHSKMIYFIIIILIWCIDLGTHYIFTPNADKISGYDGNNLFYGEIITWYTVLQGGALLFVILGVILFDEKYVVYINGMIEHNGLIVKQQRVDQLTKYWNDIYYEKEKERLCGFSPVHLKVEHDEYNNNNNNNYGNSLDDPSITPHGNNNNNYRHDSFDSYGNLEESETSKWNYHELSVNSYKRDGTQLEGTINLLIGDGVTGALKNGPSKYWPALYE